MHRGCIRAIVLSSGLFLLLAAGWSFILEPVSGGDPPWGRAALLALCGLGTALAAWIARRERADVGLIADAGLGLPLEDGRRGAAVGTLEPSSPTLLEAPFTGGPSLFYSYRVRRMALVPGGGGSRKTSVDAFTGEAMAPCAVWTKTGQLRILDPPTPAVASTTVKGAGATARARGFLDAARFVDVVRPGNVGEATRRVREEIAASLVDAEGYRIDRRITTPGAVGTESPVDLADWDLDEISFSPGETVTVVGRYDAARGGFAEDAGSAVPDVFLHKGDAAANTAKKRAGARFMTGLALLLAVVQVVALVVALSH